MVSVKGLQKPNDVVVQMVWAQRFGFTSACSGNSVLWWAEDQLLDTARDVAL